MFWHVSSNTYARALVAFAMLLALGCSPKELSFSASASIEGVVTPIARLNGLSVSGQSCTAEAVLYQLDSQGHKIEPAIARGEVAQNGSFSLKSKGVSKSDGVRYIVEVSDCGEVYRRPLTGFKDQNVTYQSSLISTLVGSDYGAAFCGANRESLSSLIDSLDDAASLSAVYAGLVGDAQKKAKFADTFGVQPEILMDVVPTRISDNVPGAASEAQSIAMSLQATHWSPAYQIAYLWKMGSTTIGESENITWSSTANDQGVKTITVYWGRDDGNGHLDQTKPFASKAFTLTVADSVPAAAPPLLLTSSSPTASSVANLSINAGGSMVNCRSFSKLALSEDPILPPSYSDFTITCTQNGLQALAPYTMSMGDGTKTLSLWAMDAAGGISASPSTVNVILDTAAPQVTLISPNAGGAWMGGATLPITWSTVEANPVATPISIFYSSDNGSTWHSIVAGIADSGSYDWTLPLVTSTQMLVKVRMQDLSGATGEDISAMTFTVDSDPPAAPSVSLATAAVSSSRTVGLSVTCVADFAKVFVTESASAPAATDSGWVDCASSMNFQVSTGDGLKTVRVWSKDAIGNVSLTGGSVSMTLDQTAPTISLTNAPSTPQKGGASFALQFSVTEAHISTAQTYLIDYSADGGATWNSLASQAATNGPLTAQAVTVNIVWPSVDSTQVKIKVSGVDSLGQSAEAISTVFTVDKTAPTISSFQLAGGTADVALPYVPIAISGADNLTTGANLQMRLSENATFADSGWVAYAASGASYSLSLTNGSKTVYVWLKDEAGNTSASASYNISLDFGTPPTIAVTGPTAGSSYAVSATVPISWSCTGTNGLDATSPIASIQYTLDDGATYCPIASNLPDAVGSYSGWTLPATDCNGVSMTGAVFRINVSCRSIAGVVANAFSQPVNTSGWSIFVGDPWYAIKDINASIAQVSPSSSYVYGSVAGDPYGNIFYTFNHMIMKIDGRTGLVTRYAGSGASGCTLGGGSSLSSGTLNSPVILGMNNDNTSLLVKSQSCSNIVRIDTVNGTATNWATTGDLYYWTFTKNKWLVYTSHYNLWGKVYKLDLSTQGNSPVWIAGSGSGSCGAATVGAEAKSTPFNCASDPEVAAMVLANADASVIWMNVYNSTSNARRAEYDAVSGKYLITSANAGWNSSSMIKCSGNSFDKYVYCRDWTASRSIRVFDPTTGQWVTGGTLPFALNDSSGHLGLGFSPTNLLAHYSLNALNVITPDIGGTWTYVNVAGQPLNTMGNGGSLSGVAFSQPTDLKYNATTQRLWIRNALGHLRQIDYANSMATSTVSIPTNVYAVAYSPQIFLNLAGNRIAMNNSWMNWTGITGLSLSGTSMSILTSFMNRGSAASNTYPPASGVNVNTDIGNVKDIYVSAYATQNMLYHSGGKLYLAAKNGTSDVFIFSSNGSVLNRVAGKTGVGGYSAGDHGLTALGSSLTNVQHLMEIPSGPMAGDMLVIDGDWLRRISIVTESASPKIYDVYPLTNASGYTAGTSFKDFIYDFGSETNGLGTGTIYYVTSGNVVRKLVPTSDLTGGTDTAYSFAGTTLSGGVRLTLSPSGLLVLQPSKARILRVAP